MKQKHWKVSVFDKTSETIRDDTFYTTDTEAYLVFELIDEDFIPDSAMITVYNIYGTAIINVSVEVADGIARYEMPEKAIRHRGGWRTQAIYTKDGEDYTTAIIEFDVGGHLLDSKKPPVVEIENWNRLIEHAGELIDDWEQLEEIRQANETSRQTNELVREEAESNRQSEFEENELARESAESVRVANEEERELNEAERISKDSERDSKIEAVESQFQDVIDNTTDKDVISAPEIIAARNGEANLKARLDKEKNEVTTQLAQKTDKGNVSVFDINKNLGKFDQTYMTEEFVAQIAGTANINATPPNVGITTKKLSRKSVTVDKTDFMRVISDNLFDKNNVLQGNTIDTTTGEPSTSAGNNLSMFIPIQGGQSYTYLGVTRVAFYSHDYTFLSTQLKADALKITIISPSDAAFVRVIVNDRYLNSAQFNIGTVLATYDEYKISIDSIQIKGESLVDLSLRHTDMDFMSLSSNVFNKYDFLSDTNFDNTTGALLTSVGHRLSGFIPVDELQTYISNFAIKVACYDKNKIYLGYKYPAGGIPQTATFTTTTGVKYIRISYNAFLNFEPQLNIGNQLLSYEDYYVVVEGIKIENKAPTETIFKNEDMFVVEGVTEGVYSSPTMPDMSTTLGGMQSTELINLYDGLVTNHPEYVTKSILGADSLGENIYRYDFKPLDVPTNADNTPKMIIISGIHGSEKAGVYALYLSLKEIASNWHTSDLLETLRWNTHLIVIPLVNNYGFNNYTRKNENGVDLARNFPTDWVYNSDTTSSTYGGETPLSEQGAILVNQIMNENQDAIYFTSFHNFTTPPENEYFIWNAAATDLQVNLGKKLISKLTREWKKDILWLPQDETTYFGHSNLQAPAGSESRHAVSYGIQSSTFEVGERFMLETDYASFNSTALTLGVEAFINWLVLNLKNNVDYYNNKSQ